MSPQAEPPRKLGQQKGSYQIQIPLRVMSCSQLLEFPPNTDTKDRKDG